MKKTLEKINRSELVKFIMTTRSIVKRDGCIPFSLKDIYSVAYKLGIDGLIYLEKFDDKRHVNVLLELDKVRITLYDPLLGVKIKPYNEVQFGMYCKPIGLLKDEFERYEQKIESDKSGDIWVQYRQKGKLLFNFFNQCFGFGSLYTKDVASINDLPDLQNNVSSSDCALVSLFIITLFNLQQSKF